MTTAVSKATQPFIEKNTTVQKWMTSLANERTRSWYPYNLMRFLDGIHMTPDEFVSEAEKNPKQMSITTKTYLGSVSSKATARVMLSAVKSFLAFYEVNLPLTGLKIRVVRTRGKPELKWEDAEKIIMNTKDPYVSAYRFLLWSGLGLDEFAEIQNSSDIQINIERQRTDSSRTYVRIDLKPRKNNTDTYYVLVPKEYVPKFPLRTYEYRVKDGPNKGELLRGGELIDDRDMQMNWQRACVRAELRKKGLGPHTLRSAFRSRCAKTGVTDSVAEFQMGHGSRDAYGYSRECQDESYVAGELAKLWRSTTPVTNVELTARDREIENLRAQIAEMEAASERNILMVFKKIGMETSRQRSDYERRIRKLEQMLAPKGVSVTGQDRSGGRR